MDPVTGTLLAAIGGNIIGGMFGTSATKKANKANIQLQRENQGWLKEMSNTSYQRSTQDMLAAGLNPMLGFSQGGASTPGSSAARVEPNLAVMHATNSAADKVMQAAQIKLVNEQARKAGAEADFTAAHAAANIPELQNRSTMETQRLDAEVDKIVAEIKQLEETGKLTKAQTEQALAQASQLREMLPYLKEASGIETELKKYQRNSAKAESDLWGTAGEEGKAVGLAGKALKLFRDLAILTKDRK